jgi:hypothetical protein
MECGDVTPLSFVPLVFSFCCNLVRGQNSKQRSKRKRRYIAALQIENALSTPAYRIVTTALSACDFPLLSVLGMQAIPRL